MKIIISPAKKMRNECNFDIAMSTPVFIDKSKQLHKYLKKLSFEELKKILVCNDAIAQLNYERYQSMDLNQEGNPALLSYDGIQYKYMAPHIFEDSYYEYVNDRVRILSGFYGILKPFDKVVPYRLEMQAKIQTYFCMNLYDFWNGELYRELVKEDDEILNLASYEYSKIIERYLSKDIKYVTCIFGEMIDGKVKEKGVYVKMARGEMVRYMAENNIQKIEGIKDFDRLGFHFEETLSDEKRYVFIKANKK